MIFSTMTMLLLLGLVEGSFWLTGFTFQPMTHPGAFKHHFESDDRNHYRQHPTRFWIPIPNQTIHTSWVGDRGATISSLSTRGPEPPRSKPDKTVRVLCLGDSGTFGWGVNDDETYPAFLEKRLNAWADQHAAVRFEVINAGVNGYSTFQAVETYRELDPVLDPDIITMSTGRNDIVCLQLSDMERPVLKTWHIHTIEMIRRLRTGQFLLWLSQRDFLDRMQEKNLADGIAVPRVSREQFQSLVTAMIDENRNKNRPFIFIERGGFDHILHELAAQDDGLTLVKLSRWEELGHIKQFIVGAHPNSEVYAFIAEDIFITLKQKGILDRYQTPGQ